MNPPHGLLTRFELAMPDWLAPFLAGWADPLDSPDARMRLAVALAAENVRRQTGGPFAAIVVVERSGRLLGAGVNRVTELGVSLAHAEMLALSLAQREVGDWNLGGHSAAQLVTTCEPCAMCFGAIPWSGVSSLVWGARKEDAEAAGFDEGDKPVNWVDTLRARGIRAQGDVLRSEAGAVLAEYVRSNGTIYHPKR